MKAKRSLWSERHALRDQVLVVVLGLGVVLAMAVVFIVASHLWTAGPVAPTAR